MENEKLDSLMVTALEALKLFVDKERVVMNGQVYIKLGTHNPKMEDEAMWRINEAKHALEDVPELATLMEIRLLEMKQFDAHKRLSAIRGTKNG
jgi:hypothetical protein